MLSSWVIMNLTTGIPSWPSTCLPLSLWPNQSTLRGRDFFQKKSFSYSSSICCWPTRLHMISIWQYMMLVASLHPVANSIPKLQWCRRNKWIERLKRFTVSRTISLVEFFTFVEKIAQADWGPVWIFLVFVNF